MGEQKKSADFPYEFKELDPEEKAELARLYKCHPDYISVGPKKYKVMRRYCRDAANIYNMPVRSDDIFVLTYQRSGTTWTQELVWLLANNLDYDKAKAVPLTYRYPFLELFMFFDDEYLENIIKMSTNKETAKAIGDNLGNPVTEKLLEAPSPRFIKSHMPMSLLPPKLIDTAKVVYVARDPRDVAVSSFHHSRLFKVLTFSGPFKDFWTLFVKDLFTQTPFFEHVKEAWKLRNHPNMLFLFYEELTKDLPAVVRRVADFLGKDLNEEQMERLLDHLSIENFKKNDAVNFEEVRELGLLAAEETFIRKGKAGGWRDYFDEEMTQQAERWIADNLKDTDLRFPSL